MNHADDEPVARLRVERDFEPSRLAAELLATAYELLLPIDARWARPKPPQAPAVAISRKARRDHGHRLLLQLHL